MMNLIAPRPDGVAFARLLPVLALAAAAACASPEAAQRDARARVGAELDERLFLGASALASEAGAGASEAAVLALLAEPLDAAAAVRVALLRHGGLRAALHGLGVQAAELAQAARLPNPVLAGGARFFDAGAELEIGVTQPLLDLLLRPLRRRVAGAELAAAEARVADEIVAHAFAVRRAMLDLRTALEQERLHAEARDGADAAWILADDLHRAGNLTDRARTAAEAELTAADAELAGARAETRVRREQVNALLGLAGESAAAWTLAEGIFPYDGAADAPEADGLEARAVAASLELRALRARADAAAQRAGLADRSSLLPAAGAGAGAERDPDSGEWAFGPSLVLGLPLLDAGGARRAAAEAALLRELADLRRAEVDVRAAARALHERRAGAAARVRILEERHVPLHARLTLEVLREYDGMQVGAFEVIEAKRRELRARLDLLDARRDASAARLDLEELLAGHLDLSRLQPQS